MYTYTNDDNALFLKEVLVKARHVVATAGAWTQGKFAKNAYGEGVAPGNGAAVCFCTLGAIQLVLGSRFDAYRLVVEEALEKGIPQDWQFPYKSGSRVVAYNDSEGQAQEDVVAMFDKAIEVMA